MRDIQANTAASIKIANDTPLKAIVTRLDRAIELVRKKAGIPATAKVKQVLFPGKRNLLDTLFKSSSAQDQARMQAAALLTGAGLQSVRTVLHDTTLKLWMRGGMMHMMPFSLIFH